MDAIAAAPVFHLFVLWLAFKNRNGVSIVENYRLHQKNCDSEKV